MKYLKYLIYAYALTMIVIAVFLVLAFTSQAEYNRKNWNVWSQKDGKTTREQVLEERKKEDHWVTYYTSTVIKDSSKIDLDHVVPLKEAYSSGANKWDKKEKSKFANDKENLVLSTQKKNRSKGDKDVSEWLPNTEKDCDYMAKFLILKKNYNLTIEEKEYDRYEKENCYAENN